MSALQRQTYANATQPLFQPFGTGGPTGPSGSTGPTGASGSAGSTGPTGPAAGAIQQIISSTKTISPLTGSPSFFNVDNGFATTSGQEYDIQLRAVFTLDSGTPAADDLVVYSLYVGGGPPISTLDRFYYPDQTNSGAGSISGNQYYIDIRARIPCSGSDSIRVSAYAVLGMGSTAQYTGQVLQLDGNRVA